jgi:hypothetical protein
LHNRVGFYPVKHIGFVFFNKNRIMTNCYKHAIVAIDKNAVDFRFCRFVYALTVFLGYSCQFRAFATQRAQGNYC